ncbi:protein YvfG [Escherichia coli]|nr:protein YvfG [Escherichia coli]
MDVIAMDDVSLSQGGFRLSSKNAVVLKRIQHLDEAYQKVKKESE